MLDSSERDALVARIEALKDELEEIDARRADIQGQIDRAKADRFITGERADADWLRRAKGAFRHLGVERNEITRELGEGNRRLRELNSLVNRDLLSVAVRDVVDGLTWQRIIDRHNELLAGTTKAAI